MNEEVIWHDAECHGYDADLPLWRELAAREHGPVLDVGAGSGRVALDLAEAGHEVVALDVSAILLAALEERAAARALAVRTLLADAQDFDTGGGFALVVVPMQTLQLLADRAAFLRCARRALRAGGLLAAAIAEELEPYEGAALPEPDTAESAGWRFYSQPVALRARPGGIRIERVRTALGPAGERRVEADAIELAALTAEAAELEGAAAGFRAETARRVPATDDHVPSVVVMLRA